MKPKNKVERAVRNKLRFAAGATLRGRLLADVMNAREESGGSKPALHEPRIRKMLLRSPLVKLTSVAAVIVVAGLSVMFWGRLTAPAYAVGQTVEALQNVRFLHIVERDKTGQVKDERWIEIGMDGRQVRYRQDNPLATLVAFWETGTIPARDAGDMQPMVPMAIEDGKVTALYRHDKKAVILYDRRDQQYQWVGLLGEAFENLRQEGKILQANTQYRGRPAHKVWWPYLRTECYVDPETKLPMAIGDTELSYEVPPAGIFDVFTPEGYAVVDKRPEADGPIPPWLVEEEEAENERKAKRDFFNRGARALARGDYAEAVGQLEQAIGYDSWAPFWLGSAYYKLAQYESAIQSFAATLDLYKKSAPDWEIPYCNYARGLAYAQSGNFAAAKADFRACLPAMVKTLRNPSAAHIFEYADDPSIRFGRPEPSQQQMVIKMINRLRVIAGRNFGYDPALTNEQNDAAIAAWEQWLATDGTIRFTPDAELIPVPPTASPPGR